MLPWIYKWATDLA
jgi:hypothetical protein